MSKSEINELVEDWMVQYVTNREAFLKKTRWEDIVRTHNLVFQHVKGSGGSTLTYFPKGENPRGRCGSCFQRMCRNMSHYYDKNILSESSTLRRQRIKGREDELAQPNPLNSEMVWFEVNPNPKQPKTKVAEVSESVSKEETTAEKASTPKKTRKPRRTSKKTSK